MDKLIVLLMAIEGTSKNVHYEIADYYIHLLADRMQEDLNGFIDEIKENCILAKGQKVKNSSYYLSEASKYVVDDISLLAIRNIVIDTLVHLESLTGISVGDSDLLGRIGIKLQNDLAILNIVLGDKK